MNISETVTGLQHIGIPTNDIEKTIAFYNSLGFQTIYRTVNKAANPPESVAFMELKGVVVETWQIPPPYCCSVEPSTKAPASLYPRSGVVVSPVPCSTLRNTNNKYSTPIIEHRISKYS